MIKYFVIAADGQRYGLADVPTLNQWIGEGRLQPHSILQDEKGGVQVEARGVPALKFVARPAVSPIAPPPPGPTLAPGLGNPYDTPRPSVQPQAFSNYTPGSYPRPNPGMTSQLVVVWLCTIAAPLLIFFFWIGGLITSSYGLRGGFALYGSGYRTQGVILITLNVIWLALWIYTRFVVRTRFGPFQ